MSNPIPWKNILKIAKNAPSGGNSQPWAVFEDINSNEVIIKTQCDRIYDFKPYEEISAFLSIGALGTNIIQVAEGMGLRCESEIENTELPAIRIRAVEFHKKKNNSLLHTVQNRCTNRKPTQGIIPLEIITRLEEDFKNFVESKNIDYLNIKFTRSFDILKQIAQVVSSIEILRFSNQLTKTKLFHELKCHEKESEDKISLQSLEVDWLTQKMLCLFIKKPAFRSLFPAKLVAMICKKQLMQSSDLGCIFSTKIPSNSEMILIGMALQEFWLNITQLGYYIQPWTSITFFELERKIYGSACFDKLEQKEIQSSNLQLAELFDEKKLVPIFFFRTLNAAPPTITSTKSDIILQNNKHV